MARTRRVQASDGAGVTPHTRLTRAVRSSVESRRGGRAHRSEAPAVRLGGGLLLSNVVRPVRDCVRGGAS